MIEAIPLFTDVIFKMDKLEVNNNKLVDECTFIQDNLKSNKMSNRGGYQSPNILFDYCKQNQLTEFVKLTEELQSILNNIADNMNGGKLVLANIWVNINNENNYNTTHTHPGSIVSGCYYVDVPEQSGGDIVFYRNRSISDYRLNDWIQSKSNYDDFKHCMSASSFHFKPKTGNCIMFFSYLEHGVEPITIPSKRISISFNSDWIH